MGNKRIAFLIPSLSSGGAERVVSNLANYLVADYQVHIITLNATEPFYVLDNKIILHSCVQNIAPSSSILNAVKSNGRLIKRIIGICRENQIQLIIGFMTTANILSIISGKILGIPAIISERNNPSKEITPKTWKILRRLIYPYANQIIVQTEPIKQFYSRVINKSKLTIIPNPVYLELSSLKLNDTTDHENIILNVGRLSPQKGQDVLIKSFAQTNNKDWKLLIAGEGEERYKLERLIIELELEQKVELIGRIKDITLLYAKARVFAFSSRFEGFPNALIEAMYFGLPCISTDCPTGPSDLIINGINGLLSPVDKIDEFAEKLNILMQNKDLRLDFGEKSRETVKQFNIGIVGKQWGHLIDKLIK